MKNRPKVKQQIQSTLALECTYPDCEEATTFVHSGRMDESPAALSAEPERGAREAGWRILEVHQVAGYVARRGILCPNHASNVANAFLGKEDEDAN